MNFNFNETAGISQSNVRKQLEGNKIHDVKFDGVEARDIQGVQDPSKTFKVLDIKFSNPEGYFTHTVWEPTDKDYEDRIGPFGAQPSNVKTMMMLFKHLIDAVNPKLSEKVDSGEVKLGTKSSGHEGWLELRELMIKATDPGKGCDTKIKLINNNKGEAIFPYFANYNKEGKLYMSTNFIGSNIFFTNKELNKIKKSETAKPQSSNIPEESNTIPSDINFDF